MVWIPVPVTLFPHFICALPWLVRFKNPESTYTFSSQTPRLLSPILHLVNWDISSAVDRIRGSRKVLKIVGRSSIAITRHNLHLVCSWGNVGDHAEGVGHQRVTFGDYRQ
ncbi:hypothetical protein BDQ94DRAFT_141566 [Aspergillus welwitschiae]|uniref:Secreted protein n=1 Tax=Aspergillus welwitschiae TaxID=1341132 RepID=A0A3F3Q615_9EURO|nr:hypothetical protein BDQ94DRAFT_141566 [Aspergillus welwitschiae]RDH34487.1 hypothetical protein BDQ94DRAFT_141566 [Aspergillus welwitschiae]